MSAVAGVRTAGSVLDERRAARAVRLVLTASFVVFADVTIVAIAAPAIQRGLRADLTEVELMVSTYQIAYAATLVTGGRLGDIFGRRTMFIASIAAFAATSAACGLATSPLQLIVFRAFQGVSGAMLAPQVLATIQIVLPPERRARAYAAQGAITALAAVLGPALAGLLISVNLFGLGWRPVFLINVPISVVSIVLAHDLIPTLRSPHARNLDVPGSLLVFAVLASVMAALTMGRQYGWPAWLWGCLAAVPLFLWLFVRVQRGHERRGRSPLLPLGLWRDRAFRVGLLLHLVLFSGAGTFYVFYYILLENGYHVSTWQAGLTTGSVGLGAIAASSVSVRLIRRWGGRRMVTVGAVITGSGFLSLLIPVHLVRSGGLAAWSVPSHVVAGLGMGLLVAPLLSVVLAGIRSSEAGVAAGLLATVLMIGRALGVGIIGLLFAIPLPHAISAASAGQLATGMSYGLLLSPVVFTLAVLLVRRLPGPGSDSPS